MSGHSKWATTKRQKFATDAKRSNLFTRLAKNIALAAKEGGGDPEMNFKLRIAIDKAKEGNMPKDNIEKAVKRGTGEGGGAAYEEIFYEGFGPAGSAFIIQVVTDNKNRAASEIKHIFSTNGGSLGSSNSVSWMFDKVGGIKATAADSRPKEDVELNAIDAGAIDFEWLDEKTIWIYTEPSGLQKVKTALEISGLVVSDSELGYKPKESLLVEDDIRPAMERMYDALDEAEDVQNFWSNMAV
ncbi:MAG: YebC/PmpR family DNA-binding transcriptional regulator [Patescibacteria group bacterium]|jgi:transcriptional/translational regulatory protein YebC/TACO1